MQITNRYDEHTADFARDYIKIQELALKDKQYGEIKKWMADKIDDTYILVDEGNKECDFSNNWLKQ